MSKIFQSKMWFLLPFTDVLVWKKMIYFLFYLFKKLINFLKIFFQMGWFFKFFLNKFFLFVSFL